MAKVKSAKDILKSNAFFESHAKAQKHLKHEFQDYGYRIAAQLGDLRHRPIYMRLAKSEDRVLLDQALAFAIDYREESNKGKLFMWKLKQLREERYSRQTKKNFEHDYIMTHMADIYSALAGSMAAKMMKVWDSSRQAHLDDFCTKVAKPDTGRKLKTVLDLNCSIGLDSRYLGNHGLRVVGLDICKKLITQAKSNLKGTSAKVVRKKHFLEHSYKPNSLTGIWCSRGWELVPLEVEDKYLAELSKLLIPKGWLFLHILPAESDTQEWVEFNLADKPRLRFQKRGDVKKLVSKAKKFGLVLQEEADFEPGKMLKFQRS